MGLVGEFRDRWWKARRDSWETLADPRLYVQAIEKIYYKHLNTGRVHELKQDAVSLANFYVDRKRLAKILAQAVGNGDYEFSPAHLKKALLDGKERVLFSFELTDLLVHHVVAGTWVEWMEDQLPPCLYSYRKGRSNRAALAAFGDYLSAHRRCVRDPRARGLYVLKRDIKSYTDSIPVGPQSSVWERLWEVPRQRGLPPPSDDLRALIESVVRPQLADAFGARATSWRGVPTGSPIATVLFNLYLCPLDRELSAVPGAFYMRYGDDIVFAHPDASVARGIDDLLDRRLAALSLHANPKKKFNLFFNGAGRQDERQPDFSGASSLNLLGFKFGFSGQLGLGTKRLGLLRTDLRERIFKTAGLLRDRSLDERGRTLCATLNEALRPGSELGQVYAAALYAEVDDRGQLAELDYWIARTVVRALTGIRGVKGFRKIPYARLRREWSLLSLVHTRNLQREAPIHEAKETLPFDAPF